MITQLEGRLFGLCHLGVLCQFFVGRFHRRRQGHKDRRICHRDRQQGQLCRVHFVQHGCECTVSACRVEEAAQRPDLGLLEQELVTEQLA